MNTERLKNCSFVFIDLVDSSVHSKIKNFEEYGKLLESFHELIIAEYTDFVACKQSLHKLNSWFNIEGFKPRGDEAFFAFTTKKGNVTNSDDVIYAVKLILSIKFKWLLAQYKGDDICIKDLVDLAAGINQDEVLAYLHENSEIERVEGYAINYAKRVESYSRNGLYSNVFLSERSRNIVLDQHILFERHENCDLKGIGERVNLFEVSDFIFLDLVSFTDEAFNKIDKMVLNILPFYSKPWLENYILTIYLSKIKLLNGPKDIAAKERYQAAVKNILVKSSFKEYLYHKFIKTLMLDDSDILKVKYLHDIVNKNTEFLPAKMLLIQLYEKHTKKMKLYSAFAYEIKNQVEELLRFHENILDSTQKSVLQDVLKKIDKLR